MKEEDFMIKNVSRVISFVMFLGMIIFIMYSLSHPEASFPFSLAVTYTIYGLYIALMILFFVNSINFKNK